jgi:hypothetical protein
VSAPSTPHVLFVDDDDQASPRHLKAALEPHGVEARLRTPEATILADLQWADLVVVDYFLTDWPERDGSPSVARAPQNGLAAAASMRSVLLPTLEERLPDAPVPPPVAFALWSGNLPQAAFNLPDVVLPHVFSRENNLEWAFRRDELLFGDAGAQVALLAQAVRGLPDTWSRGAAQAEEQLLALLGLDTAQESTELWRSDARRNVLDCRPPLHELSERSHGLALLRWLLHRIFPYPCFLLDDLQLRARLRVDALEGGPVAGQELLQALSPYCYTGTLAGFRSRRWWRAGVEDWLYRETDGRSGSPRDVAELARRHGAVATTEWLRPVVVISGSLARSTDLAEVEDTVRVRPDDWPVFADDAFARLEEAREDPGLRALVDPADRPLLEPDVVDGPA